MAALGVGTVEVKSGYGLLAELELKTLRAIARVASRTNLPRVVPTFLALHALPPGEADRARYATAVCTLVREVAARSLARFVDAYVDEHAFDVETTRMVGRAARDAGLGVRLHVGQFSDVGGAELAAELGAKTADHLEHLDEAGARAALARANVFAGLLPVAALHARSATAQRCDVATRGGRAFVVASDANLGHGTDRELAARDGGRQASCAGAHAADGVPPAADGRSPRARSGSTTPACCLGAGRRHRGIFLVRDRLVQPWGTLRARLVLRVGVVVAKSRGRRCRRRAMPSRTANGTLARTGRAPSRCATP